MKELLSQVNISELIKVFNFQIAIAVFLIFLIFKGVFSQILLKIFYIITKNKCKTKDSKVYKILSTFFIFLGLYIGIRLLKPNTEIMSYINVLFKIICIILITRIINTFITHDAKWFKKYNKAQKNDAMSNFWCKIIRGIVWSIAGYIIIKELGYDLSGLVTGLGLRRCYHFFSRSRYSKKFA